jgi:hypothetical protein
MKKILIVTIFLIFCAAPIVVMAENKGSFELVIGNILDVKLTNYSDPTVDNDTVIEIGETPELTGGYFVINRLMVGTTIWFYNYKDASMDEPFNIFLIQPVVKYYFPISEEFLINVKVFFGWWREKYPLVDDPYTKMLIGGGAAATYMLFPRVGASIGVDFTQNTKYKQAGTKIDDTSFYVITIALGLSAYL